VPLGELIRFPDRAGAALEDRTDDELVLLAGAGRPDAFAVLVGRHSPRLVEFCIKMTGDRRAGEDAAQETWLQVWAARERYRASGKIEAFLFTIARNRCRNALRSRSRRHRVIADDNTADAPVAGGLDQLIEREQERRVHAAAHALPEKLREAVLLRFVAGLDYPDISAAIGRNESTVRSRVFHGLRRMRELLEEAP
jgi:RNA polymerase sigma-70 factor, ECF subfamily